MKTLQNDLHARTLIDLDVLDLIFKLENPKKIQTSDKYDLKRDHKDKEAIKEVNNEFFESLETWHCIETVQTIDDDFYFRIKHFKLTGEVKDMECILIDKTDLPFDYENHVFEIYCIDNRQLVTWKEFKDEAILLE